MARAIAPRPYERGTRLQSGAIRRISQGIERSKPWQRQSRGNNASQAGPPLRRIGNCVIRTTRLEANEGLSESPIAKRRTRFKHAAAIRC